MQQRDADVICIQKTKAHCISLIPILLTPLNTTALSLCIYLLDHQEKIDKFSSLNSYRNSHPIYKNAYKTAATAICCNWNVVHKEIDLKTSEEIKITRDFCPKKQPDSTNYLLVSTGQTPSAWLIKKEDNAHGGQTEANPGQKTSTGTLRSNNQPRHLKIK